jgi:small conductance mechanosensitive channel
METSHIIAQLEEWAAFYGLKIVAAVVIVVVGFWVVRFIRRASRRALAGRKFDETLVLFVSNIIYYGLLTFVLIAALAKLGVQTASLIALLGAAGLGIGLALRGFFSNLAAGLVVMVFHPFRVGDFIVAGGVSGSVEEVQIFTTRVITPDNVPVIVPNSKFMQESITNYSVPDRRRLDLVFGVSYEDDIDHVKTVLKEIVEGDSSILQDPEPLIALSELADSSMNFLVRFWVKAEDWWNTKLSVLEAVKKRFDAERISIPYPTRHINVYERKTGA